MQQVQSSVNLIFVARWDDFSSSLRSQLTPTAHTTQHQIQNPPLPNTNRCVILKPMRLDRILANAGYGSRKDVRKIIKSGRVSLRAQTLKQDSTNINETDLDELMLDGQKLNPKFHFYLALHKPEGYLSAMEDKKQATVSELLPENLISTGLFPVGRLDIDTTGLLLFTNDGTLGFRLTKPEWHVPKRYHFTYEGAKFTPKEVEQFQNGLTIGDWTCRPAELIPLNDHEAELVLVEGKFHQVKRMVAATGREVTSLKRLTHGPVTLDKITNPGEIRHLNDDEIDALYQACALERPKR